MTATHPGPSVAGHLPLFVWLSPSYPVGGFAFSHALETAVDAGLVSDAGTLGEWLSDLLAQGSVRQDALLFSAAFRAAQAGDVAALADTNELALALCAGAERRLETSTMGKAFAVTLMATWPGATPLTLEGDIAYSVAVGAACAAEGLDLGSSLHAFALATVANLVSAALRLGAVGQTDGQRVTARVLPAIMDMAADAVDSSLDDLGACAFRSDLAALQHETQYSRLFRS